VRVGIHHSQAFGKQSHGGKLVLSGDTRDCCDGIRHTAPRFLVYIVVMLDPETHVTLTAVGRRPRTFVVVDGSERGWRAMAWAIGYARSRGIPVLDLVTQAGPWQHVPDAGQLCALMATEFPRIDRAALRQTLVDTARQFCAVDGIKLAVTGESCETPRELVRLAQRECADLVVLSGIGSFPRWGARRMAARLMRRGIPVAVIP
jgi:nucleotide-binding universal stress UspA family protein